MNDHETILRTNLTFIRALLPTPQGRAVYWALDEIDRLRVELYKARAVAVEIQNVMAGGAR